VGDRAPYLITDASGNPGVVNLGGTPATDIAVGSGFACAILSGGSVRCWGKNGSGQLGLGNTTAMPTAVGGAVNLGSGLTATAISAGQNYACAVLSNSNVRCWGDNAGGELGTGTNQQVLITNVSLGTTASSVAAGFANVCALLTTGAVRCWGDNYFGEFGLGSTTISDSTTAAPSTYASVSLKSGRTATALSSGTEFNCARLDDGEAECWGVNDVGELGIGNTLSIGDNEIPGNAGVVALGAVNVSAIAAGYEHTCALIAGGGGLKCWGDNLKGELGQGDTMDRANVSSTSPSQIPAIKFPSGLTPTAVAAGASYTCALLSDGSVRCWGWNDRGQLGLGTISTTSPDYIGGASTETPDKLAAVQIIAPH
jgi:alpha-tubulin suppressor-like RCC1 family protein